MPKQNYKSILNRQIELIEYIKKILLGIQVVLLIISANLVQTIIFGFIEVKSPTLLEDGAIY